MANSADPDQLPTHLDLHCLFLRQGMSCSAREGLKVSLLKEFCVQKSKHDFTTAVMLREDKN